MVIASGAIDRRHLSPFTPTSDDSSSSFFSQDLVPTERQVGFWNSESMVDHKGSKSVFASPLEKIQPNGANHAGGPETPGGQAFKGLDILSLSNLMRQENASGSPSLSWGEILTNPISRLGLSTRETAFVEPTTADQHVPGYGKGLSSSSLSESMEAIEAQTIGDLLPDDDDDLISGIADGFEFTGMSTNQDDADEDIFCTGGGMELENNDSVKGDKVQDGSFKSQISSGHSINKQPSRTLVVRNITANIEDSDLTVLFQQYGDIRMLYTSFKHHGFVTVSYYDIRAAQNVMRALHSKPLGLMKLDVQFSFPKENVPGKDIDKGMLVVSNIDSSISNDDLLQMLSVYGDVKEQKKHYMTLIRVEFQAQSSRLNLANMERQDLGKLGTKCQDNSTVHNLFSPVNQQLESPTQCISTTGPQILSSPIRIKSTLQHNNQASVGDLNGPLGQGNFGRGIQTLHPRSLPEHHNRICNNSKSMTVSGRNASSRQDGVDHNIQKVGPAGFCGHSFDQNNEAFGFTEIGSCPLHGYHYTWNHTNVFPQSPSAPILWSNLQHPMHVHSYPGVPPHMLNTGSYPMDQHHLGSAPDNGGSFGNVHSFHPGSLGSIGLHGSPQLYPSELSAFASNRGNFREAMFSPVGGGFQSLQQMCNAINGRNPMIHVSTSYDATNDRMRSRRHDGNPAQSENKRQFELDIDRIAKGEDSRTTLMIKNIPNKYNCKLLLAVIDENHRGTYDFIYLPIDFKTFNGKKWEKFNSEKVASLAYARIQGRSALIAHFQNSSLMNEDKWCRPMLFHKDGPNAGDQEPFPVGNNVRSRAGRNRSLISLDTKDASPSTSPDQESNSIGTANSTCRTTLEQT
uniref:RRM domain-containing protein n=1 Tax=Oryza meridionalis TaxID=40149 RepID=A0A0E0DKR6_9ORYZ